LQDPRFTAFLADFANHPDRDPYGPLAPIDKTVVASGTIGTHKWSLSFAVISDSLGGDTSRILTNCDDWEFTVDGASNGSMPAAVGTDNGSPVDTPPPPKAAPPLSATQPHTGGIPGKPADVIGSILTSTVLPGTASVEATFDDQPAKLTAKPFTV